jgi:hypothetical protein
MRAPPSPALHRILAVLAILASTAGAARAQENAVLLVDGGMTVGAGAPLIAATGDMLTRAERTLVPDRILAERGPARRTTNVAYRVAKLFFLDLPQEDLLTVVNHEVMGHGARLRERFDATISYSLPAPAPYGIGGGGTSFSFDRPPTRAELLAISAAGMEADAVAARVVAERAFADGKLSFNAALRYLSVELDTLYYVSSTSDAIETESAGHDVALFLRIYNDAAAAAGSAALTPKTLRREVLASLANPMVGIAAYAIGRYLWTGERDVPVPALSIGGVRYLPLVRYQLAPYGTEWAVMNYFSGARWPTHVEVRVGRAPGVRPWGIGVERRNVATIRSWRVDIGAEIWRQPDVANRDDAPGRRLETGLQVRSRAEHPLPVQFGTRRPTIVIDVGLKTAGFVPGQPLGSGVVLRAGIGIPIH